MVIQFAATKVDAYYEGALTVDGKLKRTGKDHDYVGLFTQLVASYLPEDSTAVVITVEVEEKK